MNKHLKSAIFTTKQTKSSLAEYQFVLISDIHLGSTRLNNKLLVRFLSDLKEYATNLKSVIINGDFIDNENFNWPIEHWEVIDLLDQLKQKGVNVIYVIGNHDQSVASTKEEAAKVLKRIFQYDTFADYYQWSLGNQTFVATHGECWDPYYKYYQQPHKTKPQSLVRFSLIGVVIRIYEILIKLSTYRLERIFLKLFILKRALNKVVENIQNESEMYALLNQAHVFTGHTHKPCLNQFKNYVIGNDGSWTTDSPTFIGIKKQEIVLSGYSNHGEMVWKRIALEKEKSNT